MQKYGQHFLVSESIISQIVDAALVLRAENLVEIGPGKGALTQQLIARGAKNFTVVEIDPDMVAYLQKNLPPQAGVQIVAQNFLQADLAQLAPRPTLFVSNLPYIDAADILDKTLAWPFFQAAVFMFQKEQALRIRARAGEEFYGPLSIFSQLRAQISPICKVSRGCFNPPPKVESVVLAFQKRTFWPVPAEAWPRFKKMVNAAFLHRRKTLFNSWVLCGYDKQKIQQALEACGVDPSARAEQVPPEKYVELFALV